MSEAQEILKGIIKDFSTEKFVSFFRIKSRFFVERNESYLGFSPEDNFFKNPLKLGEINFPDHESILICSFEVKKDLSERVSKKAQYDKAKKILKLAENQKYSGGIFIFYDVNGNFRFSLIYPETIGNRRRWSNFRRYTYFVSSDPHITNKTFLKQIGEVDFLDLSKIKEAFSITAVTDIFYEEFFKIYLRIVDETMKLNHVTDDEKARDFVLLFAIRSVFLGFIQKKRWIGDDEKFILNFFQEYKNKYFGENKFYLRWLTPLFFEALNSRQGTKVAYGNNEFSKETEDKLQMAPYLNGGLFKRKSGYDTNGWSIPDREIGEFFDFLYSHSFTIEENSLEDEDLQLNPEFLGIIFERLVNKEDGAVYTPRPEVDLMCRLSLVKWLKKNLVNPIRSDNLYELFFKESDNEDEQKEGSFSLKEAQEILDKLENLAICDPAVGSGAFLVGMMQVLDEVEQSLKNRFGLNGKELFERKKQIIKNSLYGVEVKEWAVWICQLRLWLSLFVDAPDDLKNSFDPILPSLDFKVRQGDSLVQRIGSKAFPISGHNVTLSKSIKDQITKLKNLKAQYFDNKSELEDWKLKQAELKIYKEILDTEIKEKLEQIRNLKNIQPIKVMSLFEEQEEIEQEQLVFDEEKIKKIESEIVELREQSQMLTSSNKPLIWSIEFAEVFAEKDGFDIIIGNPPYVRQEEIGDPTGKIKDKSEYKKCLEEMVKLDFPQDFTPKKKINGQSDLYTYFYIRSLRLLNPTGMHTFICSNSWLDVGYGAWLQEFLLNRCPIDLIIDNHAKRSFGSADVNTIISIINAPQKKVNNNHLVKFIAFKKPFEESIYTENLLKIEHTSEVENDDTFRIYPIRNQSLLIEGTENDQHKLNGIIGEYIGNKWGAKFLRAPDVFFTILEKGALYKRKFNTIFDGERYLNTGGADGFFIITDFKRINDEYTEIINTKCISETYKIPFSGIIENRFLKGLIKDVTKKKKLIDIAEADALCLVIESLSNEDKVNKYIEWGAKQGYNNRSVTKTQKPWFKPTLQMKHGALILLPRSFNNTFIMHVNPNKYLSLRFYRLHPKTSSAEEVVAFLNSTIFWLLYETLGNKNQGEGVIDLSMDDFLSLQLPIIISKEANMPFGKLRGREIKNIFEECGIDPKSEVPIEEQEPRPMPDRVELDNVIFDALELTEEERKEVYRAVCHLVWNRISKAGSV